MKYLLPGIFGYIQVKLEILASEDRDIMSRIDKYTNTLSNLDSMESLQELTDIIDELERQGIVFNSLEIKHPPKRRWVRIFKRVWRREFTPSPPPREYTRYERRRIDRLCQLEREREEEFMRMRNSEWESESKIIMWDEKELEDIPQDEEDIWWM